MKAHIRISALICAVAIAASGCQRPATGDEQMADAANGTRGGTTTTSLTLEDAIGTWHVRDFACAIPNLCDHQHVEAAPPNTYGDVIFVSKSGANWAVALAYLNDKDALGKKGSVETAVDVKTALAGQRLVAKLAGTLHKTPAQCNGAGDRCDHWIVLWPEWDSDSKKIGILFDVCNKEPIQGQCKPEQHAGHGTGDD